MAAIVRWNPLHELEAVQQRMRRMIRELEIAPVSVPAADVYETDDELVVQVETPGFGEDEIDVEVRDRTLTVRGERKEEQSDEERDFWYRERLEKSFERSFELPPEADTENVSAAFAKGVLEVRLPLIARAEPRKIEIAA